MPPVKDRSTIINLAIKYGSILLFICALVNVYMVMRYRELYTKSGQAEQAAQRYLLQQRAIEGVLRDFSNRAANDPTVMQILQRAQEASNAARQQAAGAATNQSTPAAQ